MYLKSKFKSDDKIIQMEIHTRNPLLEIGPPNAGRGVGFIVFEIQCSAVSVEILRVCNAPSTSIKKIQLLKINHYGPQTIKNTA